jgi:hypothetical protein
LRMLSPWSLAMSTASIVTKFCSHLKRSTAGIVLRRAVPWWVAFRMSSIQPLGCPKRPLKLTRKDRSKTPTFTGLLTKILSCVITVIRRLHPKCQ